ncbi:flagellar biosynthetic protein FliO [Gilliamella sp. wkB18]|jgi:flagellar protein FliO/FliZ|uniref:flagellar biosynthetic protein FliO n=1 Tax=Gilliamella sp. wkB18 TaxID=3120260 RepID=UPI0004DD754C|nr:flagellar biosynthetic protein FliO [Gilliamella apicola]KFA58366.1 Flagellar biogenesis protein [Gilliamella apicola]OCG64760.1 flagellar biosynthetic protein FliO [Gilliamella apicola]
MPVNITNLAQPQATITSTNALSTPPSEFNIYTQVGTSMGMSFIGIIGVILLLGWLVRRLGLKKTTNQFMDIKATYSLSPKEHIILVHVDQQLLVVGVTPQQMTLLHTINEQRTEILLSTKTNKANFSKNNLFQQILQSTLKSKKE